MITSIIRGKKLSKPNWPCVEKVIVLTTHRTDYCQNYWIKTSLKESLSDKVISKSNTSCYDPGKLKNRQETKSLTSSVWKGIQSQSNGENLEHWVIFPGVPSLIELLQGCTDYSSRRSDKNPKQQLKNWRSHLPKLGSEFNNKIGQKVSKVKTTPNQK